MIIVKILAFIGLCGLGLGAIGLVIKVFVDQIKDLFIGWSNWYETAILGGLGLIACSGIIGLIIWIWGLLAL